MPAPTLPSEIAREVLRLIAARRLPPTPQNFTALYHEVAGTSDDTGRLEERLLKSITRQLPRDTAERARFGRAVDQALAEGNAENARQALGLYFASLKTGDEPAWNELIATLLRQWEARQMGWTTARKRESLERVLAANDPKTLFARLRGLVDTWSRTPSDPEAPSAGAFPQPSPEPAPLASARAAEDGTPVPATRLLAPGEAGELLSALRELLQLVLEAVLPPLLDGQPELAQEAAAFADQARTGSTVDDFAALATRLRKFGYRLELVAGDRAEIHAGVLNLLRLLLENIDQIVVDDSWLQGQIEVLRELVGKPDNVRLIDDAERRLREVIYKQSQLKHNHSEAQRSLREMLAGFIDHLADFADTTGAYHDRIADCADRIGTAKDIGEIGGVLVEVMQETRAMRDEAARSRDELQAARERVREAEAKMDTLQQQLDEASRLMRHDQLTGTLNRRGLEELFAKEASRSERSERPLSVALLDLDNFKQFNDRHGHSVGDEALVHLATIIRQNLRPQDTLARHGGEEFVLLYPDTTADEARSSLVRLQRELTRNFFLAHEERVLITFSAGVTQCIPGDTLPSAIDRADAAMYQAKSSGRNKVTTA